MNRNLYKTKQKEYIVDFFKKNEGKLYSAKEIHQELIKNQLNVGFTTVYRIIDNLVLQNVLTVSINELGKEYIYLPCAGNKHFHLICDKCGLIHHIDCDSLGLLVAHLSNDHGFDLNTSGIILKGVCKKCI